MRWLRTVVCSLGVAAAASSGLAQQASPAQDAAEHRQSIGGTGVSLVVPDGFRLSQDFPGIGRAEDLSSVLITELDVPLSIAADAFTESALKQRGIELESTSPIEVDGRQATLIRATQRIGSMTFRKWFLLLGSQTRSVLLTATTPAQFEERHRDALVHTLEGARWNEASRPASAPALSFRVKDAPPLRIVRSGNDSIVLSDPAVAKGHVAPVVTVGASQARVDVGDLAAFARSRLEETVSIREISIDSQGPRALGALRGHQISATALDTQSGRSVHVQQILASDGSRYYLMQGILDVEDAARLAPAFEALAASFELAPGPAASGAAGARGPGAP